MANKITYLGLNVLAGLIASGNGLKITRVAVGTGILTKGYDPAAMTDLITFKQDGTITGKVHEDDTATITCQVVPEDGSVDFAITEVGVYVEDEDGSEILYSYADLSEHPQPVYKDDTGSGNSGTTINIKIFVSSISQVSASLSPAGLVTIGQLDLYMGTPAEYEEKTYAVGDYCTRNGRIYRCTSAISSGEEWNDAHWEEVTLISEILALRNPEFDASGNASGITNFQKLIDSITSKMSIFSFFANLKTGLKYVLDVGKIVNNGTTTEAGKFVLDAIQANPNIAGTLAKQIQENASAISSLNASLAARFEFINYGDFEDISKAGVYYVSNAVANKPDETGGLYVLGLVDEGNNIGLYISANSAIDPIVCSKNRELYRIQKKNSS